MAFRIHSLTAAEDIDLLVRLMQSVDRHESLGLVIVPDMLRLELLEVPSEWHVETLVWLSGDDTPVAMASFQVNESELVSGERVTSHCRVQVDPVARDTHLPAEIMAWFRERTLAKLGPEAIVETIARVDEPWKSAWMAEAGLRPDRRFLRMKRDMSRPVPPPDVPAGYFIRSFQPDDEVALLVEAFNLSFAEHYGHYPETVEEFKQYRSVPDANPAHDLAAYAPDGSIAGVCWCGKEMSTSGPTYWINVIGTVPAHRGIGLGRALLRIGLALLAAEGAPVALLGVDGDNAHQPDRLYRSEGFEPVHTTVVYNCPVGELSFL